MITFIVGELHFSTTPVVPQRPKKTRRRPLLDGRLPLEETPNRYAETGRIPGAPRPNRVPVEGQEILR